jgi:hypothetical protein
MTDLPIVGDFSPDFGPELAPANLDNVWCNACCGRRTFEVVEVSDAGRTGWCYGCGERKTIPWERTNSEAA